MRPVTNEHNYTFLAEFGDKVIDYLRVTGYSQKNLADALGLHPKVLGRKLHSNGNSRLTQLEIGLIIKTLALWKAVTTQEEAVHLLDLAHLKPTSFTVEEWQLPPLSQLEAKHSESGPSIASNTHPLNHNLPAPATRLIGREWAVERLQQLLARDEVRLVTLIGAGGSGKTRLALQVAAEMISAFLHGAWFVTLAGVSDPTQVPESILQALDITPSQGQSPISSLANYLLDKKLLLVLDNFEQVLGASSFLGELLAVAPGIKVLVTSRVVLHLYGEREFSVPPLDIPDLNLIPEVTELGQYPAIQLFLERAQAVAPEFTVTAENGPSIAQICARLDGLPLALELAAARIKLLTPALLLERLSGMLLSVLTGGAQNLPSRQQTLRHTFEWSYNLLSPTEQQWFTRLAIFTGGWSLEALEALMQAQTLEDQENAAPVHSRSDPGGRPETPVHSRSDPGGALRERPETPVHGRGDPHAGLDSLVHGRSDPRAHPDPPGHPDPREALQERPDSPVHGRGDPRGRPDPHAHPDPPGRPAPRGGLRERPETALDLVGQLLDKSLVMRQPVGDKDQVRFTMLETVREYALERLAARGELERLRYWHARYYLGLAEAAGESLNGSQPPRWPAHLALEQENFRAALDWSLSSART